MHFMSELEQALQQGRQLIEAGLDSAEAELAALDARRAELTTLIAQAKAALGSPPPPAAAPTAMTLHEALVLILQENGNQPMTVRQLADAVNGRGLYRKRDGSPVEVNLVHARTSNYEALFEKNGPMIRLREESPVISTRPPGIELFKDDDDGFFEWIQHNPDGYFLNTERNPKPTYLVLHRSGCSHFDGAPEVHWTKAYIKFCARDRDELEQWAATTISDDVTLCGSCFR
jgi:HB1/ASXL restriction endonuclease-like protein with HTH domain